MDSFRMFKSSSSVEYTIEVPNIPDSLRFPSIQLTILVTVLCSMSVFFLRKMHPWNIILIGVNRTERTTSHS